LLELGDRLLEVPQVVKLHAPVEVVLGGILGVGDGSGERDNGQGDEDAFHDRPRYPVPAGGASLRSSLSRQPRRTRRKASSGVLASRSRRARSRGWRGESKSRRDGAPPPCSSRARPSGGRRGPDRSPAGRSGTLPP